MGWEKAASWNVRDITNPYAPAVAAARGVPPAPGLQPCLILPRQRASRLAAPLPGMLCLNMLG